ncbi:hypothetical protein BDR04DRAFT_1117505 [Suillus decipiens]|nr:hypothetical protein BDR04DRAFT_1117505 [Suillus decipiens]
MYPEAYHCSLDSKDDWRFRCALLTWALEVADTSEARSRLVPFKSYLHRRFQESKDYSNGKGSGGYQAGAAFLETSDSSRQCGPPAFWAMPLSLKESRNLVLIRASIHQPGVHSQAAVPVGTTTDNANTKDFGRHMALRRRRVSGYMWQLHIWDYQNSTTSNYLLKNGTA